MPFLIAGYTNMATAVRKPSPSSPSPTTGSPRSAGPWILRVFDAIYRFLASLKLAVLSLTALAATLAYATFFESWYGASAAREWVYQGRGFAILLAFLGTNILCAALIRYPWKKRQTGFLVTHTGLLIVLAGSWISLQSADEGQVGLLEGETKNELIRRDAAAIRVRKLDPHTGTPDRDFGEYELSFLPGTFPWGPEQPKDPGVLGAIGRVFSGKPDVEELLTRPRDPFKLAIKAHLPASVWTVKHEADPSGDPMIKLRPRFKPPGAPRFQDILPREEDRWFVVDQRFRRKVKNAGPAKFTFQYTDSSQEVDDFLNPPEVKGPEGAVRLRYNDKSGKLRTYDWALSGQEDKTVTLPESDLAVHLERIVALPGREMLREVGEEEVAMAEFQVTQGQGPAVKYIALASMPNLPNMFPGQDKNAPRHEKPLLQINYFLPPVLGANAGGMMGLVDVLATKEGAFYYRVFRRGAPGQNVGQLRGKPGPIKKREDVTAFGGDKTSPMSMTFQVEDYLAAGREEDVCEPIELPKGKKDDGIAASLVSMTVGDETKTVWVSRSPTLDKRWQKVFFPSGSVYEVAYDMDRKALGFDLTLDDFDRRFDPATEQPSRFVSQVRLNDERMGIKDKPVTIQMNEPLTHRGYTFYQSSYQPEFDPRTGDETGRFISVLQVATDPGREIKYAGCALVVLGAFLQFYMRAGIFTDGGKRERARAEAKAQKRASRNGSPTSPQITVTDVSEAEETL